MAAVSYGVFLASMSIVFKELLPQPAGTVMFFGFFTAQISWFAITIWRRTGLPFMTAAMVIGAVMSLCLAVLAAVRRPYQEMSAESWALMIGAGVSAMLLVHIESRVNPSKLKQCRQHTGPTRFWDMLTGRNIPRIRD